MIRFPRRATLVAAAIVAGGCAGTGPIPPPTSTEHGLVIVRAETHGALFFSSIKRADSGTIEALDDKGGPLDQIPSFRSALGADGFLYFLNLPAGRYALRSASFKARGVRYVVKTNEEEARKAAIVLAPGKAAYAGTHRFASEWPEFWTALGRALRILLHWATPWTTRPLIPRDGPYRGVEFSPDREAKALLSARGALAGTPWRRLVEERVRLAGVPEPPPLRGALRPKELPLREEKNLSWRDSLGWGDPRRVAEGYEWRAPEGQARAVVFFTTASAPGFAGFDAAKRELTRRSSVDDTGALTEVRVSTRVGLAGRSTSYGYPDGTLVGSEVEVVVTETVLIPDAYGTWTARLRAPRGEFAAVLPKFREFLTQLVFGPPRKKAEAKPEAAMPVFIGQ